jgi:hypothetical protein
MVADFLFFGDFISMQFAKNPGKMPKIDRCTFLHCHAAL